MGRLITIDINFLDDANWQEHKHPRNKSGEFTKGQGEKGIPYAKLDFTRKSKVAVHKLATSASAEADPHTAAQHIHALAGSVKTVAPYANKVLRAMEEKHGLPKQSLGTIGQKAPAAKPTAQATPAPEPEPKPEPKPAPESTPALPLPHPESVTQASLYQIATDPDLSTPAKVKKLEEAYAPGTFSQQYKSALKAALSPGGEAPKSSTTKAPMPAAPNVTEAKRSASWHAGMKVVSSGVHSTKSDEWDTTNARKAMPSAAAGFWSKMPSGETMACKKYIGGSSAINNALRDPSESPPYVLEAIHAIDAAFEHPEARTSADMVVHRGMPVEGVPIEKLEKALQFGLPAAFHWDGFVSTSFAHKAAFSDHELQVEIGVPKGSPALAFGGSIGLSHENEVLLPHGRAFQVLSIEKIGKQYRMKVVMK